MWATTTKGVENRVKGGGGGRYTEPANNVKPFLPLSIVCVHAIFGYDFLMLNRETETNTRKTARPGTEASRLKPKRGAFHASNHDRCLHELSRRLRQRGSEAPIKWRRFCFSEQRAHYVRHWGVRLPVGVHEKQWLMLVGVHAAGRPRCTATVDVLNVYSGAALK